MAPGGHMLETYRVAFFGGDSMLRRPGSLR